MLATGAIQGVPGSRGGPSSIAQVHVVGGAVELLEAGFKFEDFGLEVEEVAGV